MTHTPTHQSSDHLMPFNRTAPQHNRMPLPPASSHIEKKVLLRRTRPKRGAPDHQRSRSSLGRSLPPGVVGVLPASFSHGLSSELSMGTCRRATQCVFAKMRVSGKANRAGVVRGGVGRRWWWWGGVEGRSPLAHLHSTLNVHGGAWRPWGRRADHRSDLGQVDPLLLRC